MVERHHPLVPHWLVLCGVYFKVPSPLLRSTRSCANIEERYPPQVSCTVSPPLVKKENNIHHHIYLRVPKLLPWELVESSSSPGPQNLCPLWKLFLLHCRPHPLMTPFSQGVFLLREQTCFRTQGCFNKYFFIHFVVCCGVLGATLRVKLYASSCGTYLKWGQSMCESRSPWCGLYSFFWSRLRNDVESTGSCDMCTTYIPHLLFFFFLTERCERSSLRTAFLVNHILTAMMLTFRIERRVLLHGKSTYLELLSSFLHVVVMAHSILLYLFLRDTFLCQVCT